MHSTTIKIDGAKLRDLLENRTNKTIYQIAQESGYSKNVISNAIKKGYASSAVQNIARLYDITPDDYKVIETDPEPVEELKGQISIDDIESIKRDELKHIVKEAIVELLGESAFTIADDPIRCQKNIFFHKRGL
jgi:hypothetical protein